MHDTDLFLAAGVCYALGTVGYLLYLAKLSVSMKTLGFGGVLAGLIVQLVAFAWRFSALGYLPIASFYEAIAFFLWCLLAMLAVFHTRYNLAILGSFLSPLALIFLVLGATAHKGPSQVQMPSNPLFPFHVVLSFLGEAVFTIACAASVMYLIQERQLKRKHFGPIYQRLPSLSMIEQLNAQCLYSGFVLLSVGVALGFIMARQEWGQFWTWDPKLVFSTALWALIALALITRRLQGWTGRRSAVFILFTFVAVLMTFMGVNFMSDRHRFG
ncbi:MAG: cytochrome c biogenesis protein CcsA [Nitrospirae bacterium]|nr:cytochrome c biogenesis protein CcsA [Nitrospirota bacterium]